MSPQKSTQTFGYSSWVYKAFSTEDAHIYALRRIEGFRLSNENDIRVVQRWKKVTSANIVTIHNAWTTTKFGDSCKCSFLNFQVPILTLWSYCLCIRLSSSIQNTHGGPLRTQPYLCGLPSCSWERHLELHRAVSLCFEDYSWHRSCRTSFRSIQSSPH